MQLISLRPADTDARAELAACLEAVGRRRDAGRVWDEAFQLTERRNPKLAIAYAKHVARLTPGEVPLQVRVAEMIEAHGSSDDAYEAWVKLGTEARRFGRADDQARFLERALALRPDDMDTLLSAAEARVVQGESRIALGHLQRAYSRDSSHVRLLTLLGRALQDLGQIAKARKVWLQAARRHAEAGDRDAQVDALRHALECSKDDAGLKAELEQANVQARRHRARLDERSWADPQNDAETMVIVRADTLRHYGFLARALADLEAADDQIKASVSWAVHHAELLIRLGETAAGIEELRAVRPPTTSAELELADRLEILGGATAQVLEDPDDDLIEDENDSESNREAVTSPPPVTPSTSATPSTPGDSSDEGLGDRLASVGDRDGALAAYRRAIAANPADNELLMKIGELMTRSSSVSSSSVSSGSVSSGSVPSGSVSRDAPIPLDLPEPETPGVDFGAAFGDVDPDAISAVHDGIAEARALVTIARYEDALDALRGQDDIEALVVGALAARGLGRQEGVQTRLERAVQIGGEHHPAYVEALWELAGTYMLRHKVGNAERLLDEIAMLDSNWRPVELAARRRGLEILRER
ncbi:MAG: hypothetical protein GXP62_21765 [Oligoflexia bacterium]|nr:hypothetical protein [Oligoflexia bacterium]